MHESLSVIAGLIAEEASAAAYLARQGPLDRDQEVLIARTMSAGIAQLRELHRELILICICE